MTVTAALTSPAPAAPTLVDRVAYWAPTAAFCILFAGSALWNVVDLSGGRADTVALGFPAWTVVPFLTIAKLLGVIAVLVPRWPALTSLAFAGFLFDVLLALGAHLVSGDLGRVPLAVLGIVLTVGAYMAYRRRYRFQPPVRSW